MLSKVKIFAKFRPDFLIFLLHIPEILSYLELVKISWASG